MGKWGGAKIIEATNYVVEHEKIQMFDDFEKKSYKDEGPKENTVYFLIDIKEKYVSRFGEIK